MNTLIYSIVSVVLIVSTILSPISPIIEKIGDSFFLRENYGNALHSNFEETGYSNRTTLEDEFTIPESYPKPKKPLTKIPSFKPKLTTEPTSVPDEGDTASINELTIPQEGPPISYLVLSSDKDYVVAGEDFELNIEPKVIPTDAKIEIYASQGFSPKEDYGKNYQPDKNILNLPVQAQSVVWQTAISAQGPFYFVVKIVKGEDVIEEQNLAFDQAVKGTATPEGGSVSWKDKGIKVSMGKGAVNENINLFIRQAYAHPIAPYNLSGHSIVLLAKDDKGNEITTFNAEVNLEIAYDPEEFAGNETTIFIKYYDEEKGDWFAVPTQRDLQNQTVSATISHFSEWDLEAGSWEMARLPNLDNFNMQGFSGAATFDYPIELPAGPGGFAPELNLSYNSSMIDGINIYTQADWAGMGWNLNVGAIVRNQHGTSSTEVDDTFSLNLGGIGGLLIKEETDPASNVVNYFLQDENFFRIQYYISEDAWIVWNTTGTQYIFGGKLDQNGVLVNDELSGAYYPTTCNNTVAYHPTWNWGLKQIINSHGQKITVNWDRSYRQLYDYCGTGTSAYVILDSWPTEIIYPHGNYRILLESNNDRVDYHSDWHIGVAFYSKRNLDKITIQKIENGQWVTAWFYDFTYAQDLATVDPTYSNFIMPLHLWEYWTNPVQWRKTLTLVAIKKCYSAGVCDPEYTFEYDDGMHLTAAENGQGGRVKYSYDPAYETTSSPIFRTGYGNLCGNQGAKGTFGWTGNCKEYSDIWFLNVIDSSELGVSPTRNYPGAYYRYFATVSVYGHGDPEDWFKGQLTLGANVSDQSSINYLHNNVWTPENYLYYFQSQPELATRLLRAKIIANGLEYCPDQIRTCHGMAAFYAYVQSLTTKYRVIEKTIIDEVSGDEYSYIYTYDEFATNDVVHSQNVQNTTDHCGIDSPDTLDDEWICYERIYNEFRGHGSSTITDPSGKTNINYYHQDDTMTGRKAASMTAVSQFGDNFENGLNPTQWTIALSGGANDAGYVTRHYGDNALMLREGESIEWSHVVGSTTTSPDGKSVIVQFMPQAGSEFALGVQDTVNPNFKWQIIGNENGISAQYGDGSGLETPQMLIDSIGYEANQWYVVIFTLDHEDGYSVRVWKRTDPEVKGFYTIPASVGNFSSGLTWQFKGSVSNGRLYLDEYMEAYIYELAFNEYNVLQNPNSIVVDPPNYYQWGMNDFPGFNVHWVSLKATEIYTFEGGSAFQATRTEYDYADTPQFGNVTGTLEKEWMNGSFINIRQSNIDYYPTDTGSSYIISLPAQETVYGCSAGGCNQNLLSITQNIYDSNAAYYQAPTVGELTRVRNGVDQDASTTYWSDTMMTYDSWGNQTGMTQYTSYGTDTTFATQGAQTTTTTYDQTLHTYPVTITPALSSHQMSMTYDTLRGLPQSMTDPNGLVTLLCYDNKARLIGSVKGDSANPPTCNSEMEISINYHEAVESSSVWAPFWTEASQVLSLDTQGMPDLEIAYRKFYDGIGRQIQTQTVGVDLDGFTDGSQTIINDFFYNPNGLLEFSSMPYNVTTPTGFSTQPTCTTSSCVRTIYDALSREIETQAPDGSVTQTYYGFDASEELRTVTVADTLQNSTTTYQDIWGQTVRVVPETGPWTEYSYDLAGQLVQVDQANVTGVFASTYMAYDLGGRKLEMNDPDMGVWTYEYDAMNNLISQIDANLQGINLCYDDLNRLTGKFYGSSGDCSVPASWDVAYYYDGYTEGIFNDYSGSTTNAIGRRTGMLDRSGQTGWSYDQRGNLTYEEKQVGTETFTTEWVYSIGGLLEEMVYPLVNGESESIYTTYHPQGNIASVESSLLSNPTSDPTPTPTATFTATPTPSPVGTFTATPTPSPSNSATPELTATNTQVATSTQTPTPTATRKLIRPTRDLTPILFNTPTPTGYAMSSMTNNEDKSIEDDEIVINDLELTESGTLESQNRLFISLTYDEAGRSVNRTYFDSGDGLQTNFDYFNWNEQVNNIPQGGLLESSQTGTMANPDSLVSLGYIYDAVGNIASITDLVQSAAQVQTFTYDSLYRLSSATGSNGFGGSYSEGYSYDPEGRMDSKAGDTLSYIATRTGTCQTNSLTPAASSTITHAVSSKSGGNTYTYDCNGNAISRGNQTLIYDEENSLVEVQLNSVSIAEYTYDGDGNRVESVVTDGSKTITTVYIGSYYEQITTVDGGSSTTEWNKYYYAGAVRLAMRENSEEPYYLISDHLGSTSLVVDSLGQEVARQSYLPFGGEWGSSVTDLPTTFTYTGQREAAEIGLHYYIARWYDAGIGHFLQADIIVPGVGNPMAWNRYGYVMYNPLKYTDPSGHWTSKKQFLEIFVGTLQDREIGLGGEKINIGRFGDLSNSGLRKTTSYSNSVPDIELPSIQIKVDDWEDFLIDVIGIVGDTLPMIAITTDVVGFLPDDLLVPFVWISAEGAEFIQATSTIAEFSKGIHDFIIEGEYENLHDAVQSATVQQLLEIMDNTGIYKFGKLIPVVGIGFNLYDLNKNVHIEMNYLED